jgi:tetratricopeptide (TPR) repeat protein
VRRAGGGAPRITTPGPIVALWAAVLLAAASGSHAEAPRTVVRAEAGAPVRAVTAALMVSGQEGGNLPMALLGVPLPGRDDSRRFAVVVELAGRALLEASQGATLEIELFVYAFDADQGVDGVVTRSVSLEPAVAEEGISGSGVKLLAVVEVPPGGELVRVLARAGDGLFGLRSLTVPGPAAGPMLLVEAKAPWLVVLGPSGQPSGEMALEEILSGGLPSALPVVDRESPAGVRLLWDPRQGSPPAELSVVAERRDRAAVEELPFTVSGWRTLERAGVEVADATFDASTLRPGHYRLTPVARTAGGEVRTGPPSEILVGEGGGEWPAFEEGPGREGPPPVEGLVVAAAAPAPEALDETLESSYAAALRRLAEGDRAEAGSELRRVETMAPQADPEHGLERLRAAEWRVLRSVAGEGWEGLLPVALLHADAVRGYRMKGEYALAGHGLDLVIELTTDRTRALDTPEAAREGAELLAQLGEDLVRSGVASGAERLFAAAVGLRPDHGPSHLGLALLAEKEGRLAAAEEHLRRFLAVRPEDREGLLRLAVVEARSGAEKPASKSLDGLCSLRQPRWVVVVACQELARLGLERNSPREAVEAAERGLRMAPDDLQLHALRGLARERQGNPLEAREEMEVAEARPATGSSPRHRYNCWPERPLTEARGWLEERSESRLVDLRRVPLLHEPSVAR